MGILDSLFGAAREANEAAHGARLESGLRDTMAGLARMQDDMRFEALMRFLVKRSRILPNLPNWSRDGCLSMAKTVQDEARKRYDFDIVESYALWMTGAWLEGSVRESVQARATSPRF